MKKKILSLVLGMFMGIISLFSLTSCSIVKTDEEKVNSKPVLQIGDKVLTRGDVINSFYTYYQNNAAYFQYYGSDVVEESFYQWLIIREVLGDMAKDAVYNKEKNPNGVVYYTKDDEKEVLKQVKDYFYNQVGTKEKPIYAANKDYESSDDYPIWIRDEEKKEDDKVFKPYEPSQPEIDESKREEGNLAYKLSEKEVKALASQIEKYIFEYVPDENDKDSNDEPVRVAIDETNYIAGARKQAYINYKAELVASGKNDGTTTDMKVLFENEIVRVYEVYYNAKITSLFQDYYINEYLTNHNGNGDSVSLSDAAIVEAFINQYYTDKQLYSSEKEYIKAITSSDGASLLLYHYEGKYYYFSVQHILLKFSDYLTDEVNKIDEKNSSSNTDYYGPIAEVYRKKRDELAKKYNNAILTNVNDKNDFTSIALVGDYYYYDEAQKNVYDVSKNIYGGYIKLSNHSYDGTTLNYNENFGEYAKEDCVLMANQADVLECYDKTFVNWKTWTDEYLAADEDGKKALIEAHKDMEYVFQTASDMNANGASKAEIYSKVSSLLFVELEWIYSADSLDNNVSNKIGYIVSSFPDNNGSWVVDFAVGARKLLEEYNKGGNTDTLTMAVTSDYGTHIMKIENVYTGKSVASEIEDIIKDNGGKIDYSNKAFVERVIKLLKSNYVSTASNETLYSFFYEKLYTNFAGSGSSTGTYFLAKEYEWLSNLYNTDQIKYINKLTYEDLVEALS